MTIVAVKFIPDKGTKGTYSSLFTTMKCHCLPPAGSKNPKILILGSMPGQISMQKQQYFAHPQNSFWKIMGDLIGAGPDLPYGERLKIMAKHEITLWESLQSCIREGSADSNIREEVPNDFNSFLKKHRNVSHIFFDGKKAFQSFQRLVRPSLDKYEVALTVLPSTSPRYAVMNYKQKLDAWKKILSILP